MIADILQLDFSKQYTYAHYLTQWFDERVELMKGYVHNQSPAPSNRHQKINVNLIGQIMHFLERAKMPSKARTI